MRQTMLSLVGVLLINKLHANKETFNEETLFQMMSEKVEGVSYFIVINKLYTTSYPSSSKYHPNPHISATVTKLFLETSISILILTHKLHLLLLLLLLISLLLLMSFFCIHQ